jgi:hypothetical protein
VSLPFGPTNLVAAGFKKMSLKLVALSAPLPLKKECTKSGSGSRFSVANQQLADQSEG